MSSQKHILIVEDDPVTREMLSAYFDKEGYQVSPAGDGNQMRAVLADGPVDLVLLDIALPGDDGLSLMRELRRDSDTAVIMVTAKGEDVDRIIGLELGADDYVTKPFNPRELLARARNVLRRGDVGSGTARGPEPSRHFSRYVLDLYRRRLSTLDGISVRLTKGEFDLLAVFVQNPGKVLSRDELLDLVNSRNVSPLDRTIDVMVGRLRRKLEEDAKNPRILVTVHGVGYVFSATVS